MAKNKNTFTFDDMFGGLSKNKDLSAAQSAAEQPAVPTVTPAASAAPGTSISTSIEQKQVLQGKLAKHEKKKYDYGTKRTFPIPDDLWNDALIVMQAQGLKQVEFIQGLIQNCVDENRESINTVKRMRGEL